MLKTTVLNQVVKPCAQRSKAGITFETFHVASMQIYRCDKTLGSLTLVPGVSKCISASGFMVPMMGVGIQGLQSSGSSVDHFE